MKRLLAAAALLLLPAASGSLPIQPGKWQTIVTILDVQMPSAPPGVRAGMRGRPPQIVTACVTPQQAAAGPQAVLAASKGKCRYTSFNASGGRLNAVMQCGFATGAMTVTSTGAYSATTLDLNGSSVMSGKMQMTMKTHTIGRRLGPC
ncbi:MAG: hypothetical protein JWN66_2470 [Sphingomonas bacterium]|uniref:DUF3617 domain-containing protein n=1 Tax=Sphingomonas bacterium TaxID=1895847 RepID=UPI00262156A8|nr:DUF3617 domain-containing protein [Sphingomonas bacterium]MDB5705354.1 hypothetical protein [Sphingomonas bacterium]